MVNNLIKLQTVCYNAMPLSELLFFADFVKCVVKVMLKLLCVPIKIK